MTPEIPNPADWTSLPAEWSSNIVRTTFAQNAINLALLRIVDPQTAASLEYDLIRNDPNPMIAAKTSLDIFAHLSSAIVKGQLPTSYDQIHSVTNQAIQQPTQQQAIDLISEFITSLNPQLG